MGKREVRILLSEKIINFIEGYNSYINDVNINLKSILETHYYLFNSEKDRIKKLFEENEWYFIFDIFNKPLFINTKSYKMQLVREIEDAVEFYKYDEKWGVDSNEIIEKICSGDEFSCYIITKIIEEFFNNNI